MDFGDGQKNFLPREPKELPSGLDAHSLVAKIKLDAFVFQGFFQLMGIALPVNQLDVRIE